MFIPRELPRTAATIGQRKTGTLTHSCLLWAALRSLRSDSLGSRDVCPLSQEEKAQNPDIKGKTRSLVQKREIALLGRIGRVFKDEFRTQYL
uniref:Uncharacterized protein n=1 Tax=Utricularia reniformis TaxID=192314 RepID=A0A1Y0B212_9LAMI|nr:hypothetical protein AEK19_MT1207 [Utricularia reniformis]ART31421.1 hypothetical protein AEK19_MT1207 [Utricularia reniformis]